MFKKHPWGDKVRVVKRTLGDGTIEFWAQQSIPAWDDLIWQDLGVGQETYDKAVRIAQYAFDQMVVKQEVVS